MTKPLLPKEINETEVEFQKRLKRDAYRIEYYKKNKEYLRTQSRKQYYLKQYDVAAPPTKRTYRILKHDIVPLKKEQRVVTISFT